ncbi:Beta-mannosidase [Oopsacas minuta]|uniref:Beta-mannosidase n=1 Tax=Oopsacas minuta TaxID=111878 RepID=A0AAV7JTX3_9METZ|nr:Beta-mannosidase [Oopsacas minuta]
MLQFADYFFTLLSWTYFTNSVSCSFACSSNCTVLPLNGKWLISTNNNTISLQGIVPGQIHLDLLKEKLIPDPYVGFNDDKLSWIPLEDKWVSKRNFTVDSKFKKYEKVLIYFEGIDTIASVFLQNAGIKQFLFNASNQHRQYVYDVTNYIVLGDNTLIVELLSAAKLSHKYALEYPYHVDQQFTYFEGTNRNFVRKAQSDFGWDWGPAFAPVGIWKDVYMVGFDEFMISNFVPIVYWNDTYDCFEVKITVYISCTHSFNGKLIAEIKHVLTHPTGISCSQGDCEVVTSLLVPVNKVSLWWPSGYGEQQLYDISVEVFGENRLNAHIMKCIGFRKVELIQEKYPGEEGLSFYFKINNLSIFIKGSNWIPADAFTGRVTAEQIDRILTSAVLSHQNMVRVWGGGIYQQDEFYQLCNRKGILVWQEFMFACSLYPRDAIFLENVHQEIKFQVRRLAHNPSLILWSGNNENQDTAVQAGPAATVDYTSLYDDVIRSTLYQEDNSRPFWPSSPSNGDFVVDRTRQLFVQRWGDSQNNNYGDIHRYDYNSLCTDISKYPRPRFISEFGFQSYPSMLSLQNVINDVSDLDNKSPFMLHRQHHPNGNAQLETQIQMHFILPENTNRITRFSNFIFLTQIVQGICMQSQTEHYRRIRNETGHTMGTLYWQLNDIWQAPSWSSIEYNGRWKVLHYMVKRFYCPILISGYYIDNTLYVYVINDANRDINIYANVYLTRWNGKVVDVMNNSSKIQSYSSILVLNVTGDFDKCGSIIDCYFYMELFDEELKEVLSTNYYFPVSFKEVSLPKAEVKIQDCYRKNNNQFTITISSDALALYVFLETKYSGYFSDNAFIMKSGTIVIEFYSWTEIKKNVCQSISIKSISNIYSEE